MLPNRRLASLAAAFALAASSAHAALTVTFSGGTLTVTITQGDDVVLTSAAGEVLVNGATPSIGTVLANQVTELRVVTGDFTQTDADLRGVTAAAFTALTSVSVTLTSGGDVIEGSEFAETFTHSGGGPGSTVRGNGGDDTFTISFAMLNDGLNLNGGLGTDSLLLVYSSSPDSLGVIRSGTGMRFEYDNGAIVSSVGDFEEVAVAMGSGDDTVVVGDLTGVSGVQEFRIQTSGGNDTTDISACPDAAIGSFLIEDNGTAQTDTNQIFLSPGDDTFDGRQNADDVVTGGGSDVISLGTGAPNRLDILPTNDDAVTVNGAPANPSDTVAILPITGPSEFFLSSPGTPQARVTIDGPVTFSATLTGVDALQFSAGANGDSFLLNQVDPGSLLSSVTILGNSGANETLIVNGSSTAADTVALGYEGFGDEPRITFAGGAPASITASNIDRLELDGLGGADSITLDQTGAITTPETLVVRGGDGNDTIDMTDAPTNFAVTLRGGNDDDTITGGSGGDTIDGEAGDDTLNGRGGIDTVNGGGNNDTIFWAFGNGDETLQGGLGTDTAEIVTGEEADTVGLFPTSARGSFPALQITNVRGSGIVELAGIENLDVDTGLQNDAVTFNAIAAFTFNDVTLRGGAGDDTLDPRNTAENGISRLVVNGDEGNDTLFGTNDTDTINGGANDDAINGFGGNDSLNGNAGNDTFTFNAGAGDDSVTGGAGTDEAIFAGTSSMDDFDVYREGPAEEVLLVFASGGARGAVGQVATARELEVATFNGVQGADSLQVFPVDVASGLSTITFNAGTGTDLLDIQGDEALDNWTVDTDSAFVFGHMTVSYGAQLELATFQTKEGNETVNASSSPDTAYTFDGGSGSSDTFAFDTDGLGVTITGSAPRIYSQPGRQDVTVLAFENFPAGNAGDVWSLF